MNDEVHNAKSGFELIFQGSDEIELPVLFPNGNENLLKFICLLSLSTQAHL